MSLNTWLLFVTTVFLVSATPGPNMLLAMTHGMHYGVRRTLVTCLGLMTALGLIMLGSAVGLGAVLSASKVLFPFAQYAGAAYFIYLGIKTWRSQPEPFDKIRDIATSQYANWEKFRTGFLVAMSNPKAFIFFTALFPQFMTDQHPKGPQLAILAVTFYIIEASWQLAYASGGAHFSKYLNNTRHIQVINKMLGSAFVFAGLLLSSISRH